MKLAEESTPSSLSASDHASVMAEYIAAGEARAAALGNRGPIRFDSEGGLAGDILESYREHGFYVFAGLVGPDELAELQRDVDDLLDRAPVAPGATIDRNGRPAAGLDFVRPGVRFARPLSDPLGGTTKNKGRHPVKMLGPAPATDAPEWTVNMLDGNLHLLDSCLRLYGHPGILAAAEAICGSDFVPYNEVAFIKEPGLGPSVAWHRDGTTHWDSPDWNAGAHGFNSMTQLYGSTSANGVWMLPGSHRLKTVDIEKMVVDSGSERIDGAVPLVCGPGDVIVLNRQAIHGSFANTSDQRRITLNAGFFPRDRVLDVTTTKLDGVEHTYDAERIHQRSRMIAIGINARWERFPDEVPFLYQPMVGHEHENQWTEQIREACVNDYNQRDMYI